MRDITKIKKDAHIVNIKRDIITDKAIQLKCEVKANYNNKNALVKFTRAIGWEHLSVCFIDETPTWEFMQEMKEMFWEDEEVCYQLHPKKSEYINNNNYALHIWRSLEQEVKTPPTLLVGFRDGNEEEDKRLLKQMQEELGSPISDAQIELYILNNKLNNNIKVDTEKELKKITDKYGSEEILKFMLNMM